MLQDQTAIVFPSCVEASLQVACRAPVCLRPPLISVASSVSVLFIQLTCRAPMGNEACIPALGYEMSPWPQLSPYFWEPCQIPGHRGIGWWRTSFFSSIPTPSLSTWHKMSANLLVQMFPASQPRLPLFPLCQEY